MCEYKNIMKNKTNLFHANLFILIMKRIFIFMKYVRINNSLIIIKYKLPTVDHQEVGSLLEFIVLQMKNIHLPPVIDYYIYLWYFIESNSWNLIGYGLRSNIQRDSNRLLFIEYLLWSRKKAMCMPYRWRMAYRYTICFDNEQYNKNLMYSMRTPNVWTFYCHFNFRNYFVCTNLMALNNIQR